jgi:hypothetical protein
METGKLRRALALFLGIIGTGKKADLKRMNEVL